MKKLQQLIGATLCGSALLTGAVQAQAAEQRELRVYNWADYMLPSVPKDFQQKTGIKLTWDTYESNEALEAKLLALGLRETR